MANSRKKNLPKNIVIGIIISVLLIIILIVFGRPKEKSLPNSIGLTIKHQDYYLEIAQNSLQRAKGLSGRDQICSNCGMLFVFKKEGIYPFWMKNTKIPLDMIWIDSDNKVVKIATALETNSEKEYANDKPAKYVIELNANEVFKLDLKIGDTIPIPGINE